MGRGQVHVHYGKNGHFTEVSKQFCPSLQLPFSLKGRRKTCESQNECTNTAYCVSYKNLYAYTSVKSNCPQSRIGRRFKSAKKLFNKFIATSFKSMFRKNHRFSLSQRKQNSQIKNFGRNFTLLDRMLCNGDWELVNFQTNQVLG